MLQLAMACIWKKEKVMILNAVNVVSCSVEIKFKIQNNLVEIFFFFLSFNNFSKTKLMHHKVYCSTYYKNFLAETHSQKTFGTAFTTYYY